MVSMIVVNYTFFIFANHYKCVNKKTSRKDVNALFTILNDKNDKEVNTFLPMVSVKGYRRGEKVLQKILE